MEQLKPKINNCTLSGSYLDGSLKDVNIKAKIISLQRSWIKRLFDNNSHNWKIIPLGFINKYLGKDFKFHSNLQIDSKYVKTFPKYFKEVINAWSSNKNIILGGDFNMHFDSKLEAKGGKPVLKK